MTAIDLAILGIVIFSMIISLVRGFTRELLSLFSWMTSGFLTYLTYPIVHSILKDKIHNPMLADILSIVLTFACFLLLFGLFSHILANWIQNSALGGLDRSLGLLFGILRAGIILCVFEIVANCFISRASYPPSSFSPYVMRLSDVCLDLLPQHVKIFLMESQKNSVTKNIQDAKKTVDELAQLQPKQASESESFDTKSNKKIDRLLTQTDQEEAKNKENDPAHIKEEKKNEQHIDGTKSHQVEERSSPDDSLEKLLDKE